MIFRRSRIEIAFVGLLFTLLPALCVAGAIIIIAEPTENALYVSSRVDIRLETADNIDLVADIVQEEGRYLGNIHLRLFVCQSPGWYATALGFEGGILNLSELVESSRDNPSAYNWPAHSVSGVCGLDTREDAERDAVSLCNEDRANVTCDVGYSGFDDGTVSFYSEFEPEETSYYPYGNDAEPVVGYRWLVRDTHSGIYWDDHALGNGQQIRVEQHDRVIELMESYQFLTFSDE